jgi:rubrerythrin
MSIQAHAPAQAARARAERARQALTRLLQLAYSGELAATRAYLGHRHSLSDPAERAMLARIIREEIRHRHCLLGMLAELGSAPDPLRERKMNLVGRLISFFCLFGGWFLPMYGAAKLEAANVGEYETAARLAHAAGFHDFCDALLEMAEVEWDHERYFREKAMTHALWRVMPKWSVPPPRAGIRATFEEFASDDARELPALRVPLLVR